MYTHIMYKFSLFFSSSKYLSYARRILSNRISNLLLIIKIINLFSNLKKEKKIFIVFNISYLILVLCSYVSFNLHKFISFNITLYYYYSLLHYQHACYTFFTTLGSTDFFSPSRYFSPLSNSEVFRKSLCNSGLSTADCIYAYK